MDVVKRLCKATKICVRGNLWSFGQEDGVDKGLPRLRSLTCQTVCGRTVVSMLTVLVDEIGIFKVNHVALPYIEVSDGDLIGGGERPENKNPLKVLF
jgi:hypothetical protein